MSIDLFSLQWANEQLFRFGQYVIEEMWTNSHINYAKKATYMYTRIDTCTLFYYNIQILSLCNSIKQASSCSLYHDPDRQEDKRWNITKIYRTQFHFIAGLSMEVWNELIPRLYKGAIINTLGVAMNANNKFGVLYRTANRYSHALKTINRAELAWSLW